MQPADLQQLQLFATDLDHAPTIAERRGDTTVSMCSWCGLLAAVAVKYKLAQCPACGRQGWIRQPVNVGPFRRRHADPADHATLEQAHADHVNGLPEADQ